MPYVLIEHHVKDYATFKSIINYDGKRRSRLGCKGMQIFQPIDDPNQVVVLFEWDDLDNARAFAGSLETHEAVEWMGAGITMPRLAVIERVACEDA